MIDPFYQLFICFLNFIFGLVTFIFYYGILKYEKNRKNIIIYILDIVSVLLIGALYLYILTSNKIEFHIYYIIFITIGYLLGLRLFKKSLEYSYSLTFNFIKFILKKLLIIWHWCFDIIPIKYLLNKVKVIYLKYKLARVIKKFNKKINTKIEDTNDNS